MESSESQPKHPFDGMDPETFANNLFGPEDERKETCFQCGSVWYSIHFKDGLCNGCQEKGLPGRSFLKKKFKRSVWVTRVFYGIPITFFIWFFFLR